MRLPQCLRPVAAWLVSLPVVTRTLLSAAVVLSVLTTCRVVAPDRLCLPRTAWEAAEVWRYVTNMVYRGNIGMGFLMSAYFFTSASTRCERDVFEGDTARYVWFLAVSCGMLAPLCYACGAYFLGGCVVPLLIFVSCRTHPHAVMQFFLGIQVQALYFPLVLMGLDLLLGQSILNNVLGCLVGHLYVYHCHLTPRDRALGTAAYLPCEHLYTVPRWVDRLIERERVRQLGTGPLPASWGH
eukprot:TRINITY_DN30661_c0_g1_i1.p1 TRINITY_DN30661_c0_g1~~TRINITY_DN30661_c0_g1_i1.p1  ORF type:complete len:240 (+),score=57.21 TRINITY_DN30661_c0_g1_i1:45-764(+)